MEKEMKAKDLYERLHDLCKEVDDRQEEIKEDDISIIISVVDQDKPLDLVCTGFEIPLLSTLQFIASTVFGIEGDGDEEEDVVGNLN